MKQYTFKDGFKCVASTKEDAIAQHNQFQVTAARKKGGPHRRSYTKVEKISRSRKEISLIKEAIKKTAEACGLITDMTERGDALIYGKKGGIENDNSFSIFAYDDYNSGYVIQGIKGYYNTYMPDLRACTCVLQLKIKFESDPLSVISTAYSRIARIIAKYTKNDKSSWSKFSTELFKIDVDKLKSDKESVRNNAKKEAEKCLKTMEAKVKKTGAKIIKSHVEEYDFGDEDTFKPYVLFSFNDAIFGGIEKSTSDEVILTLSSRKMDMTLIGDSSSRTKTFRNLKEDCSNVDVVLKKSVQSFQESIKTLYESVLKSYNKVMQVKV